MADRCVLDSDTLGLGLRMTIPPHCGSRKALELDRVPKDQRRISKAKRKSEQKSTIFVEDVQRSLGDGRDKEDEVKDGVIGYTRG